jgi:hypothetical protein
MIDPHEAAEQAERQARIQEDIRRLFARYRRTAQTDTPRAQRFTPSAPRDSMAPISSSVRAGASSGSSATD